MKNGLKCKNFGLSFLFPSARKLKRLNLGGNELVQVPQKALSLLDMLKKLEIQENKIRKITEGDFAGEIKLRIFRFRMLNILVLQAFATWTL
jgi:Leucine rich repeat